MTENDLDTGAGRESAGGVPPMFPGGERQSVAGCIVFVAVALFSWPVLYLVDTHLDRSWPPFSIVIKEVALTALCCLPLALACGRLRWAGYPGTAWIMLASLGTATLLWTFVLAFANHGIDYAQTIVWAAIISLPAWLLSGLLTAAGRSQGDADP